MIFLKRTILIGAFLILAFASQLIVAQKTAKNNYPCNNQFEVDHIGYERIQGPVESMDVERETLVAEGHFLFTNKGKPYIFASYKFDRIGRLSEKHFYRLDGVSMPKTTYDYDPKGLLLRENHFSAITNKPYLETNYVYENGLLKELIGRNIEDDGFLSKQVFSYDPNNRIFEFIETKSYKSPTIEVGFKQDEKCRFSEIVGYGADGKRSSKTVITFDKFDNPILINSFSVDGSLLGKRKYEYKYDVQNNWVEQADYSWRVEDGKATWILVELGYRKIKYFDTK